MNFYVSPTTYCNGILVLSASRSFPSSVVYCIKKSMVGVCEREIFMTHSSTTTHLVHRIPPLPGDANTHSSAALDLVVIVHSAYVHELEKRFSPGIYMLGGKMCVKVEIYEVDSQIKDFLLSSSLLGVPHSSFWIRSTIRWVSIKYFYLLVEKKRNQRLGNMSKYLSIELEAGVKSEIKKKKKMEKFC